MSLSLKEDEPLAPGLQRIFQQELAAAQSAVDVPANADPGRAVHEARKRLKSLRAALRLVRPALGDALFADENARLRDLGRPLSSVRDAQVMLDTLADLTDHFKNELARNAFAGLRTALRRRRKSLMQKAIVDAGALSATTAALTAAAARAAHWPLTELSWPDAVAALARTYRQGRHAMAAALDDSEDNALHQWRKRVKDLRHQLAILQPLWPAVLSTLEDQAHTLGAHLGADHDFAVLSELLENDLRRAGSKQDRQALTALIERRRQTLQKHATELGRRIYAEKPRRFQKRMMAYVHSSQ